MKAFYVFLFFISNLLFSQSGSLQYSTFQQSIILGGAGQIGVSIPNDDVLGYYLNPAILGSNSKTNHFSFTFTPKHSLWADLGSLEVTSNNLGFNFGYNLKNTSLNAPISIGFGYSRIKMDYGTQDVTTEFSPEIIGSVESYDLFNSFSLGVGIDYFLQFNFGITLKSFESALGSDISNGNIKPYIADGSMLDYGFLVTVPISALLKYNSLSCKLDNNISISPVTNFSVGLSSTNHGDEIYYVDEAQKDPLSRTAILGYTFELGLNLSLGEKRISFVNYTFSAEAEDLLIAESTSDNFSTYKYQNGIGDINFSKNLISLKSNDKVILHKGHILKFFDTFVLSTGSVRGRNFDSARGTNGVGFTTKGIFNLIDYYIDNELLKYITSHFIIEYYTTNYKIGNRTFGYGNVEFDALSIHFVGFEL